MKTVVTTCAETEMVQIFPRLFSHPKSAEIAVFCAEMAGTWLTGEQAGKAFMLRVNVYMNSDWSLLPVGHSVTLTQE